MTFATVAFVAGTIYLRGGRSGLKQQGRNLAVVALGLAAVFVLVPLISSALAKNAWAIVVLGLNAGFLLLLVGSRRSGGQPDFTERQRTMMRTPAFRWMIVVFLTTSVVATVLLAVVAGTGR